MQKRNFNYFCKEIKFFFQAHFTNNDRAKIINCQIKNNRQCEICKKKKYIERCLMK